MRNLLASRLRLLTPFAVLPRPPNPAPRGRTQERLLAPAPLSLVKNGRMNRRNMRREFITEEELRSQMRLQGITELEEIKHACLEATGDISIVKAEGDPPRGKSRKDKL